MTIATKHIKTTATAPTREGTFEGVIDFNPPQGDSDGERITNFVNVPGEVILAYMHTYGDPGSKIGTASVMVKDDGHLLVLGRLDVNNGNAMADAIFERLLLPASDPRALSELSVGFDYEAEKTYKDANGVRVIVDTKLLEVSVVYRGAQVTSISGVKAASAFAPARMTDANSQWRCSCGKYGAIPMMPTTALGERVYVGTCVGCGRMWGVTPFEKSHHVDAMAEIKGRQIMAALKALADNGAPTDVLRSAFESARFAVNDVDYTVADLKSRLFDLVDSAVDDDAAADDTPPVQTTVQDRELLAALDELEGVGEKRRHPVPNEADRVYLEDHLRRFHGNQVKPASLVRMNLRELQATHRACHPENPFDSTTSVNPDVSMPDAPKAYSPALQKFLDDDRRARAAEKAAAAAAEAAADEFRITQEMLLDGPLPSEAERDARYAERVGRELTAREERDRARAAEADRQDEIDAARRTRAWRTTGAVDYVVEPVGAEPVPRTVSAPLEDVVRITDGVTVEEDHFRIPFVPRPDPTYRIEEPDEDDALRLPIGQVPTDKKKEATK